MYKQYNVKDIQILKWIIEYNTFAICQAEKADKKQKDFFHRRTDE